MADGIVIKLGGSLMDIAGCILTEISASETPALIIPGGGVFADFIRHKQMDDDAAHWQAIAAMNRYGRFLSTFGLPVTDELTLPSEGKMIFLPQNVLMRTDPLPHSWEVTSDSISLWAAEQVGAPLLLIKSRAGDISEPGMVDEFFLGMQNRMPSPLPVTLINGRDSRALASYFSGRKATRL